MSVFRTQVSSCAISQSQWLRGLSAYTTDQSLRQLFSPFGQIRETRVIKDTQTQRPKGFGFITFESDDDAQKAMKALDGKIVNGRLIFVEAAKEVESPKTDMTTVPKLEEDTQQSLQHNLRLFSNNHSRVLHSNNSKE